MYEEMFRIHSDLLKAMSHPRRLEIIQLLRGKALSVGEIQDMLHLPQANISQHLQILREAGVTVTTKKGKQVFYKLTHKNFIKACDLMREILLEKYSSNPMANELTKSMADLVPVAEDPVCHMRISPKTAGFAYDYKGQHYYFCASGCEHKFRTSPETFVGRKHT